MKIKIENTNEDATEFSPVSVKVSDAETGQEIRHIAAMSIKMFPGEAVRAYLDVYVIPELIEAEAILSLQSLMEAADFYGFKLVRKEEVH